MHEYVEEVDIRFLQRFAAYPPTYLSPKEICSLTTNIEQEGIKNPLVLSINPFTKKIRLDSGNHRVYVLPCIGYTTLPCVAYVSNTDIVTPSNGDHLYDIYSIKYDTKDYSQPFYCKVSEVLDEV